MKVLAGILWGIAAQVLTFYQLQGQMKYPLFKNNQWIGILLGIPVSFMFMKSVKCFVEAYNGQLWPSRLIGFGIGVTVFTFMSYYLFREPLNLKTLACLSLGVCIILIQLFWR